jgi:hypothetical protein
MCVFLSFVPPVSRHARVNDAWTLWLRNEVEWVFDCGWSTRVVGEGRPIRSIKGVCSAGFILKQTNQTPMNKTVHYLGLDVHKDRFARLLADVINNGRIAPPRANGGGRQSYRQKAGGRSRSWSYGTPGKDGFHAVRDLFATCERCFANPGGR